MKSYSDEGELVLEVVGAAKTKQQKLPIHVAFARPNKISLDLDDVMVASDGKTLLTSIVPLKRFNQTEAPKAITFRTFEGGPIESVLSSALGMQSTVLMKLLLEEDAEKALLKMSGGVVLSGPDEKVGDQTLKSIVLPLEGPDFKILIDPKTKQVKKVETVFSKEELASTLEASSDAKDLKLYWTPGKISTDSVPADAFVIKPPKGFEKIASLSDLVPEEDGPGDGFKEELVGKAAPEFTVQVLDGPGKLKKIKKSDLAGKVVVIDFWATWCGPCLMELPEIQKLMAQYVKDKKQVAIIAVSQDQDPAELPEVRKLVEKTMKENKLELLQPPVGFVALDPTSQVGEAFKPPALPSLVLIDPKGVVQAVHVGFGGDTIDKLSAEIDTLLAGDSLLTKDKNAKK